MNLSRFWTARAPLGLTLLATLLLIVPASAPVLAEDGAADEGLSWELREQLIQPLRQKVSQLASERNADGMKNRRGIISKNFKRIDDDTYQVSFQQDTAGVEQQLTERLLLTLKRKGKDSWEIAEEQVVDTYDKLYRTHGQRFYPFDGFSFDEGGLKMTSGKGNMYEWYLDGEVAGFTVMADSLKYDYTPPKYQDFYQLYKFLEQDYTKEIIFQPQLYRFLCDPQTCEKIIAESFTGLQRPAPAEAGPLCASPDDVPGWVDPKLKDRFAKDYKDRMDARKENPFAHFVRGTRPGNHWFYAVVQEDDKHGIYVKYNNWEGFEYEFWVYRDAPGSFFYSPIFGYYTDETLANNSPYELETRDDNNSRWHDLYKVKGEVSAALEDAEELHGDIVFGINLKQDVQELPFFIATLRRGENEQFKNPTMFVNSVQYEGEDLTCVRTGPYAYVVVLPKEMPAGSKIELRIDFSSRVIYKVNHAYSQMFRGGWLPFVRFGDMIDEFDLVVKTPSKYDILGIGRKVSEEREGDVLVTHWVADNPVMFPTIIFGKYRSDRPRFDAKKADGTVIPVAVHVDEASFTDWGIRPDSLRPIAEQAANSINLYREVSGLDYPYGELNLVNDPVPVMYGQAPSSLIYLGSPIFRGEGTMATYSTDGTGTAKFLKSVVSHEVAHQWWGSRVANANDRNYWFVETMAEYFSAVYLENVYGRKDYDEQVGEWRKRVLEVDQRSSIQNASALWGGELPGAAYQAAVYNKGPLALHVLRETFGDEKFFPALKKFSMELAGKGEVVTEDLRMIAEEAFGGVGPDGNPYNVDLSWFFDQWFRCAGIPQYVLNYDVRRAEDGTWIVEGKVKQRVVVGNKSRYHVLDDKYYRGVVQVTVTGKDKKEYPVRFVVEGPETPFAFKVPVQPRDVALNKGNEMLSLDVLVNRDF